MRTLKRETAKLVINQLITSNVNFTVSFVFNEDSTSDYIGLAMQCSEDYYLAILKEIDKEIKDEIDRLTWLK